MSKNRKFVCFWCDESGATIKKKINGTVIYFHKECYREFLRQEFFDNNDNTRLIEQNEEI